MTVFTLEGQPPPKEPGEENRKNDRKVLRVSRLKHCVVLLVAAFFALGFAAGFVLRYALEDEEEVMVQLRPVEAMEPVRILATAAAGLLSPPRLKDPVPVEFTFHGAPYAFFHHLKMSWAEAKAHCEQHRGSLASGDEILPIARELFRRTSISEWWTGLRKDGYGKRRRSHRGAWWFWRRPQRAESAKRCGLAHPQSVLRRPCDERHPFVCRWHH